MKEPITPSLWGTRPCCKQVDINSARPRSPIVAFPAKIFVFALVLRLVPVLLTRQLGIGLDDMFQYDMLARSLASGNGFRWYAPPDLARLAPYLHLDSGGVPLDPRGIQTTFRAPLYPALLSLIYMAFGVHEGRFFAVRLVQTLLGGGLAPMTYAAARIILRDVETSDDSTQAERGARLAALIVALYPSLLLYPLALATENLFFPLLLGSVLALLRLPERKHLADVSAVQHRGEYGSAVLIGLLLGLTALTRSVILPFAGLAVFWIWLVRKQPAAALVTAVTILMTVAPWVLRNSFLSGRLTGIETSMGYNLYVGYHPESTGTFTFGPSVDLLSITNDRDRDEIGMQRAIGFIRDDPLRFPYLAMRRLGYFFNLELRAFTYFYANDVFGAISPLTLALLLCVLGFPFVVLSLSGVFGATTLPNLPAASLLGLLLIGYLLPHVLILSEERFHVALIPFIAICASNAWVFGSRARRPNGLALAVAIAICILLLTNWGLELSRDWPTYARMLGAGGNQLYLPY